MKAIAKLFGLGRVKASPLYEVSDHGSEASDSAKEVVHSGNSVGVSIYDLCLLGITVSLSGHYFAWTAALKLGFGGFAIIFALILFSYCILISCISEVTSTLPFAGGAYGIGRVTLGIYPGYLVAYFDAIEAIMYAAGITYVLGLFITLVTEYDSSWEPLYWVAMYAFTGIVQMIGGKLFWMTNRLLALAALIILVIYICAAAKTADFMKYAPLAYVNNHLAVGNERWITGSMHDAASVFFYPCYFFIGADTIIDRAIPEIKNPKTDVPRAYFLCMIIYITLAFGVLFVCVSSFPGVTYTQYNATPTAYTFMVLLHYTAPQAIAMTIPVIVAATFGYVFCYSRQLCCMGQSGLVPAWLGYETPGGLKTPLAGYLTGSLIGFGVIYAVYKNPAYTNVFFQICMMNAVSSYILQLLSYVRFKIMFPQMQRDFSNPTGITGAVFSCIIFAMVFISLAAFQTDQVALIVYCCCFAVATIYYFTIVQYRQFFSEEEKKVMFKAHLQKNNYSKASRLRKGRSSSGGSQNGGSSINGGRSPRKLKPNRSSKHNNNTNSEENAMSFHSTSSASTNGILSANTSSLKAAGGGGSSNSMRKNSKIVPVMDEEEEDDDNDDEGRRNRFESEDDMEAAAASGGGKHQYDSEDDIEARREMNVSSSSAVVYPEDMTMFTKLEEEVEEEVQLQNKIGSNSKTSSDSNMFKVVHNSCDDDKIPSQLNIQENGNVDTIHSNHLSVIERF